jgi:hypothetical protein
MWLQVLVVVVVVATQSILAATAIDWSNITVSITFFQQCL